MQTIESEIKEEQEAKVRIVEQGVRVLENIGEIEKKIEEKVNFI